MEKLRRIPSAKKTKTWKKIKNGKKTGKGSHGCLYIIRDFVGLFNISKGGKETAYRSHRRLPQKLHIEEVMVTWANLRRLCFLCTFNR